METGCDAQECWYQNNKDRIREFSGLETVIVNDPERVERYELSCSVGEEDEIQLCDVCLNHVSGIRKQCKICNRWMLGLCVFSFKDMCTECVDWDHLDEILAKDELVYKEIYKHLVKAGFVIPKSNTEIRSEWLGKPISCWDENTPLKFAKDVGIELDLECMNQADWRYALQEFLDDEGLYESTLKLVTKLVHDRVFARAVEKKDAQKEAQNTRKRARDEQNCERVRKWIPSIDMEAYARIKKRLGLKGTLKDSETVEDLLVNLAASSSIENERKPVVWVSD